MYKRIIKTICEITEKLLDEDIKINNIDAKTVSELVRAGNNIHSGTSWFSLGLGVGASWVFALAQSVLGASLS